MRNVFIRADKRGRVHTEKSRKIFLYFLLAPQNAFAVRKRAQIFLKRRRHIAVPAPPFRD